MTTRLISPLDAPQLEIRCNVGDYIVANLAMHFVFFFERRLDPEALSRAFAQALTRHPIFDGRMGLVGGRMVIRCQGQGVPFTTVSSGRGLRDAIRSTSADNGRWLVDPVNGPAARWGRGPLCKVRVTHLADDATAIGFSFHHSVGDMQTVMQFMNTWVAAAGGQSLPEPLIVEDRAGYLDERLPADGAREPGVRVLGLTELARSAAYLATGARKQQTLRLYFGDDEIARMRAEYGSRMWLSANDVVCGHVSEALMKAGSAVDCRTLAVVVNARKRCGLDPMLAGNIVTTLNVDLRRGEAAASIAERIRHQVDHFADEHSDMRINQRVLDSAASWRAARCVAGSFDPARWNPLITNLSSFGVYRTQFEDTFACYYALLMTLPFAGVGAVLDGAGGHGLVFQMSLPANEFRALSSPALQAELHQFRCAADDIPALHRLMDG